jgi:hypothetical protein
VRSVYGEIPSPNDSSLVISFFVVVPSCSRSSRGLSSALCLCLRASQEYGDDGIGCDDVKDFFNDAYPSIRSATTAEDSFLLWYFCFHFFLLSPLEICVLVPCFRSLCFRNEIEESIEGNQSSCKHFLEFLLR